MKKTTAYILTAALTLALVLMPLAVANAADGAGSLDARKRDVHAAAELLRELGVPEDDPAIAALQAEWWRCEARMHPAYTEEEVIMLAKTMWGESRGIASLTENACIAWTACNRVDDPRFPGTIAGVLTQPGQMYYRESFPAREDLLWLARDVLERWTMERLGYTGPGRVLAPDYLWYSGDGAHNYFRTAYRGGTRWGYELESPYKS